MEQTADNVRIALAAVADPARIAGMSRFFKTGPGEYGEGDVFAGIRVPDVRAAIRPFRALPLDEIDALLTTPRRPSVAISPRCGAGG